MRKNNIFSKDTLKNKCVKSTGGGHTVSILRKGCWRCPRGVFDDDDDRISSSLGSEVSEGKHCFSSYLGPGPQSSGSAFTGKLQEEKSI